MSFPSHSGHGHVYIIPSHSHSVPLSPSQLGFREESLKEEDLLEGECLCDFCNGYGYTTESHFGYIVCKKCQGIGKLDWIERIVGKKEDLVFSSWGSGVSGVSGASGVSGIPGYYGITGASGASGVGGLSGVTGYSAHTHTIPSHTHTVPTPRSPPVGTVMHESLSNETKIFDGEKWVLVEPEKTIWNKILNGMKKLFKGVHF